MTTASHTPLHLSNLCTLVRLAVHSEHSADEQRKLRNHAFAACGLSLRADDANTKVLFTLMFLESVVLPTIDWLSTSAPAGLFVSQELTQLGRYVYAVAGQDENEMSDAADALGIRDGVSEAFLLSLPVESPRSNGIRQIPFPFYG